MVNAGQALIVSMTQLNDAASRPQFVLSTIVWVAPVIGTFLEFVTKNVLFQLMASRLVHSSPYQVD